MCNIHCPIECRNCENCLNNEEPGPEIAIMEENGIHAEDRTKVRGNG